MKFVVVFAALFAVALAAPAANEVEVLKQSQDVLVDGYKFEVATSDGASHIEEGHLKNAGTEQEAIVVTGSFSYVAPDGQQYTVNYVADENGFQPSGAHLPVAP